MHIKEMLTQNRPNSRIEHQILKKDSIQGIQNFRLREVTFLSTINFFITLKKSLILPIKKTL